MTATTLLSPGSSPVAARARPAWPSLVETALTLVAIAAILPWFARLADDAGDRHDRFADAGLAVQSLPRPLLPTLCAAHAAAAEPFVRERLCGGVGAPPSADAVSTLDALADQWRSVSRAFRSPLEAANARVAALREASDGSTTPEGAIAALDADIAGFVKRYDVGPAGPQRLVCAFEHTAAALRSPTRPGDGPAATRSANSALLLAAALDGHPATRSLAASALLPPAARIEACASLSQRDAFALGSASIADARESLSARAKNEATRGLLVAAGWQWAAWMLAGLVLVKLARSPLAPGVGLALVATTWAVAAWAGRVPWPLAHDRAFVPGRIGIEWDGLPAGFVLALLASAVALLLVSPWIRRAAVPLRQTLASRTGYAGFVVATGVGWLLLLDLSANGPPGNRYLALYHHGHLWLAMLVLTACAFVRPSLGRALALLLSMINELAGRIGRRLGGWLATAGVVFLVVGIVVVIGALLSGIRQFTSELGRVWLIVGVAWFFYLRGAPVAGRLLRSGSLAVSVARYAWPLAFVALVLLGMMLVTRDLGPLLIASYAAGAFLAASIGIAWHVRSGAVHTPALLAIGAFGAWIVAVTLAVFEFGAIDEVTATRLENLAAPLASANDQLALVTWFRAAAPPAGFGLGSVPWCGFSNAGSCAGVPAQIQSDYTFTALVGAFGWAAAWTFTIGCALWVHRLVRHHGRVTRGEPRFLRHGGRVVADTQAFLSWIGVTWVVLTLCQLAVTVAGNLGVLPLTGVTFPFVSFGMTSLVVNSAFLALVLNVNLPEARDG